MRGDIGSVFRSELTTQFMPCVAWRLTTDLTHSIQDGRVAQSTHTYRRFILLVNVNIVLDQSQWLILRPLSINACIS